MTSPRQIVRELRLPADERKAARAEREAEAQIRGERDVVAVDPVAPDPAALERDGDGPPPGSNVV